MQRRVEAMATVLPGRQEAEEKEVAEVEAKDATSTMKINKSETQMVSTASPKSDSRTMPIEEALAGDSAQISGPETVGGEVTVVEEVTVEDVATEVVEAADINTLGLTGAIIDTTKMTIPRLSNSTKNKWQSSKLSKHTHVNSSSV